MSVEALRTLLVRRYRGESAGDAELAMAGEGARKAFDGDNAAPFADWLESARRLGQLEDDEKEIVVARGLRLCRMVGGAPPRRREPRDRTESPLDASCETLPGIGPKLASALADREVETIGDLIAWVPRRYDDARLAVSLATITAASIGSRVSVCADVESRAFVRRGRRRWLDVRFEEGGVGLIVRFFGAYPSALDRFGVGTRVTLAGDLTSRGGAFEMTNPDVLAVRGEEAEAQILPRYRAIPGVPPKRLATACAVAVTRGQAALVSAVPASVAGELGLPDLAESFSALHAPPGDGGEALAAALNERTTAWQKRLAFEDMFQLAAQIARRRHQRRSGAALACPPCGLEGEARAALPFALTAAQGRVTGEIWADLAAEAPMNRLLQGDVGCGKTAVAFLAAARVVGGGGQVALMAPTEILAEQHFASIGELAERCGIRVALLTGQVATAQRRSLLALLGGHKIDLVVGTHALLAESVDFASLGLVIIDEQHRFGVAQRVSLRRKGGSPHLLVMTATPIPRSLALSVYGDLDVSVIDELPPGRVACDTHVLAGDAGRVAAYKALARRLERGEQAYVVCPLVAKLEEDVGRPWRSAEETFVELGAALAPHVVALVHGRQPSDERAGAMARFRAGEARVLVSTTVIEVGVDVPGATVMIVEDADHFGLAQLHQLRGRVGRGGVAGHCALLHRGRLTADAARRLEVMATSSDGFVLAEEDLAIRGPGELLGSRQAGLPPMRFGDLMVHLDLLATARQHASAILGADPSLERPENSGLRAALERADRDGAIEAYDSESG